MARQLFESKTAGSDGTFKMAPVNYTQVYMLWSIIDGEVKGEFANRSKALPGIYILLKGKTEVLYREAFELIEKYRQDNNLPPISWQSFLLDDEKAVQNSLPILSSTVVVELCYFHVNKNIVKCLIKHKLTNFVRNCKSDGELWFYGKLKQILVLPLLPLSLIHGAFVALKEKIISFFRLHFSNLYQQEQLNMFFTKIEGNYYGNLEKMTKICKYKKQIRGTNLIEGTHGGFNKSILTPKNGTVNNIIQGLKCIDFEYRAVALDYQKNGVTIFPKKSHIEQHREQKLSDLYEKLDNSTITVESFLEQASELWIRKKYMIMIKKATEIVEAVVDDESEESSDPVDDIIDGIFINDNPPKRVRQACKKYFGEEWVN